MHFTERITSNLAQSRNDMMLHMSEQSEIIRVHLDARMLSFAQAVEAPVQQAMHASATAAGMATELAGRYVGLEDNVERTFNAAAATRQASEIAAAESLRQIQEAFQQARTNLDAATISMTQVQHENASSMAQTEALTAQLAQTQLLERVQHQANAEAVLPTTTTSPSEFGSRYNALFGSPLNPRVSLDRHASPIGSRQPSPERPRVFSTFPNSEPIQMPSSSPQMIVIQRPAVELLSHGPT
jgi:hypothetical protein